MLSSCGLDHLIEEEGIVDENRTLTPNPAYQVWRRCNQSVLALIASSLSESVIVCVIDKKTSKETWEVIKRNYSSKSKSQIMELHNSLYNITNGVMSMDEYMKEICTINEELSTVRHVIDEFAFTFVFMRGLPPEYTPFITRLIVRPEDLSLEDTITQIRVHETMMAFKQKAQNHSYFSLEANQVTRQDKPHEQQAGRTS